MRAHSQSRCKDFQLIKKLGCGAYSSVYLVKRYQDQQVYAMKKVKLSNISEKDKENALNEIRILASISHRNVVAYKDSFIDPEKNTLNIVMEFCDDGDLYQRVQALKAQKQLFAEQDLWDIFGQIVLGLNQLHRLNIYHRDIKSANIFMNKNQIYKLGDLNVSKVARKQKMAQTQTGTPYYASPEVWRDKPYDGKSDIWSVGVVMFEAMHHRPPFQGESMEALYLKVTQGHYTVPANPYSSDLNEVVKALLQMDAQLRPSTQEILNSQVFHKHCHQLLAHCRHHTDGPLPAQPAIPRNGLLKTLSLQKGHSWSATHFPQSQFQSQDQVPTSELHSPEGLPSQQHSAHRQMSNKQAYNQISQNQLSQHHQNMQHRQISHPQPHSLSVAPLPLSPGHLAHSPSHLRNRNSYINQMMQRQHHNIISNSIRPIPEQPGVARRHVF